MVRIIKIMKDHKHGNKCKLYSRYIETDIKLLNVGLLKELVDKASEAEKMSTPKSSQKEETSQQTGAAKS